MYNWVSIVIFTFLFVVYCIKFHECKIRFYLGVLLFLLEIGISAVFILLNSGEFMANYEILLAVTELMKGLRFVDTVGIVLMFYGYDYKQKKLSS